MDAIKHVIRSLFESKSIRICLYVFLFFALFVVSAAICLSEELRILLFAPPPFSVRVRWIAEAKSPVLFQIFAACVVCFVFVHTRKCVQFPKRENSVVKATTFLLSDLVSIVFIYSISGAMISPFIQDFLKGKSVDLVSVGILVVIGSICPLWYWVRATQELNRAGVRESYRRFLWTGIVVPLSFVVWLGFGICLFQWMTLSFDRFYLYYFPDSTIFDNFLRPTSNINLSTWRVVAYAFCSGVFYLLQKPIQRLKKWTLEMPDDDNIG